MCKQLLTTVVACVLLMASTAVAGWRDINTTVQAKGLDAPIHYTIGAVGTGLLFHYLPVDLGAWRYIIAFTAPTIFGLAKEATDVNFNTGDVLDYTVGSGIGMVFVIVF